MRDITRHPDLALRIWSLEGTAGPELTPGQLSPGLEDRLQFYPFNIHLLNNDTVPNTKCYEGYKMIEM